MRTEVRWGLALNGGVSLAIWIGGLCDELLRIVNASHAEDGCSTAYAELATELDVLLKLDVLAGTSAGGVNSAFLASGLTHGCRDLTPMRQLWIDAGGFVNLLRDPQEEDLVSLLRGDSYFLVHIQECLEALAAAGTGMRDLDPRLALRLTATGLDGREQSIPDGADALHTVDHRVEFRFTGADFDFDAEPKGSARIARACRSTASFPGAFEPSPVPVGLFEDRHAPALRPSEATAVSYLVDGGVLANLPANAAVDAIVSQPSKERVDRALGLVVPDPGSPKPREGVDAMPSITDSVGQSAIGIPRNQTLTGFIEDVQRHNDEVLGRRAARVALLRSLATLPPAAAYQRVVDVSEALFPSYRAARHRTSIDRMTARIGERVGADGVASLQQAAATADHGLLPWVPEALDATSDSATWGGSPVRRLAALLISWTNLAAAAAEAAGDAELATSLLRSKQHVSDVRDAADAMSPRGVLDDLVVEALGAQSGDGAAALRTAREQWAGVAPAPTELHGLLDQLADQLRTVVAAGRTHLDHVADPDDRDTLGGLIAVCDGGPPDGLRRFLIGLEVIEVAFSATDPRPDQVIRLAQFSSTARVTIDPLGRRAPAEKLAGVQLGHFGAFLKRSWRANDYLWGRLDASERAVRLLDESTGGRLAAAGTLDDRIRRAQADVLREELPVVVWQLELDRQAGARISAPAETLIAEVAAAGTGTVSADGPNSLAAITDEEAARLLGLNLLGQEQVSEEAGSALTDSIALTTLATGAQLLKRHAPRGKLPLRAVAGGSLTAYRISHMALVRKRLLLLAFALVQVIALGLVVAQLAGGDLSLLLVIPAVIVLLVCLLLDVVQAVPIARLVKRAPKTPVPAPPS